LIFIYLFNFFLFCKKKEAKKNFSFPLPGIGWMPAREYQYSSYATFSSFGNIAGSSSLTGITAFNSYIFLNFSINWFENCTTGVTYTGKGFKRLKPFLFCFIPAHFQTP